MKLAASLVVRNEVNRYLGPCIVHLLEFCDVVVVQDDSSDDGTREFLRDYDDERLALYPSPSSTFFVHEGRTRQRLLVSTLAHQPSHVISLDADEFITDGKELRRLVTAQPDVPVWALTIEEVWKATHTSLMTRQDGGWRSHPISVLWRVPEDVRRLKIMDRRLACRRVPTLIWQQTGRLTGVDLLHVGWLDEQHRKARYDRYATHDQGRFHASSHLRSILWPDERIELRSRGWPQSLLSHRELILGTQRPSM